MRSLLESILDDNILDQTDVMKDFPKRSSVGHSDWHDNYRVWYYRWKNYPFLNKKNICNYHHLYITWYTKDNQNYYIVLKGSNSDFFNSQEICLPYITMESNNEKQVRKQAYEIFMNIASNSHILKYLHEIYRSYTTQGQFNISHLDEASITVDDLKNKFKDIWQEIKK